MVGSNSKKDQAKKMRQKRRRPLAMDLAKSKKKESASPKSQPNLRLLNSGGTGSAPQQTQNTTQTAQADDANLEHVHFYIRHHDRVEMDILVSNMRFKWGITEEQTWAAVKKLEAQRAVKVLYPNSDRSNATVSALWLR